MFIVIMRMFLISVLTLILPAPAICAENVQTLLSWCKSPNESQLYSGCIGYISGAADLMQAISVLDVKDPLIKPFLGLCGRPTYGAMIQAFINWAEAHPEEWSTDRSLGVASALRQKWPCAQ